MSSKREKLAREMELGVNVLPKDDYEETARGEDIIVTATKLTKPEPLVKRKWIKPGCFIETCGSMLEIDYDIPKVADRIVVDNLEQCKDILKYPGLSWGVLFERGIITWAKKWEDIQTRK